MAGLPRVELVDGTMTVRLVGGERLEVIVPENETQAERLLFREQAQREYKASRDHTHAPLPNETCTACQTGAVAGVNVEAEIAEKRAHFEAEAEKWRAANPDFGIGNHAVSIGLAICRTRTWGEPDADGVVEHVREPQSCGLTQAEHAELGYASEEEHEAERRRVVEYDIAQRDEREALASKRRHAAG